MVLYESHSVLHGKFATIVSSLASVLVSHVHVGRPFPLKGRFYANIFIHFEPVGHSLRHNEKMNGNHGKDVHGKYREDAARGVGGHEVDQPSDLPPYIIPGTPEEANWRRFHPGGQVSGRCASMCGASWLFFLMLSPAITKKVVCDRQYEYQLPRSDW